MEIKLTDKDKKQLASPQDIYQIMQRILLRENQIDREREHFWIIGINQAGYMLYIELISLGNLSATVIEPMNVYRIAVMKNASRIIAVHNHPSGSVIPTESDKEITDRLIQVGKILNISLDDHLVISPNEYFSFRHSGLMSELESSQKYVPTYQLIEQIRQQEQMIAKQAVQTAQQSENIARLAAIQWQQTLKSERAQRKQIEQQAKTERVQKQALLAALITQGVSLQSIAEMLDLSLTELETLMTDQHE
ncbi:JAB domain-containing protein [Serratia microhaemolytica]|uniref:JAB domain-containing protein n=1 Tax=Serratia microhaemolytica TaxID=2675110 RepID=UPI000FDE08A9|nr:JAB domain-containing protein [Serratia microhaemolytica]